MMIRYVLGKEAMQAMSQSNVLIVGMKGLGIEIGTILPNIFHLSRSQKRGPRWCKVLNHLRPESRRDPRSQLAGTRFLDY